MSQSRALETAVERLDRVHNREIEVTPMSFRPGSPAGARLAVLGMDHTRNGVAIAYNATQGANQ